MIDLAPYRPLFLSEARKKLEEARGLLAAGDEAGMRMCFHTLRGMSGTMGYQGIATLAAALEEGRGCPHQVGEALKVLEGQMIEVEAGNLPASAPDLERRLRGT